MKTKLLFALLIFVALSAARYISTMQKVSISWEIVTNQDAELEFVELEVFIPQNSSHQRVLASFFSHPVKFVERNGSIKAYFSFSQRIGDVIPRKVAGDFLVEVSYGKTFPSKELTGDELERYLRPSRLVIVDDAIVGLAQNFSQKQPFGAIAANEFVSKYVEYNLSYVGNYISQNITSSKVFIERKGVCTEFSHLLIAILRSLEIPSRIVTGYLFVDGTWIPHSWVEAFIANESFEFDPTLGQSISLDASRFRIGVGTDQAELTDKINVRGKRIDFVKLETGVSVQLVSIESAEVPIEIIIPEQEALSPIQPVIVKFTNKYPTTLYTKFDLLVPEGVVCNCSHKILLAQSEQRSEEFILELPKLSPNVYYTFPIVAVSDFDVKQANFTRFLRIYQKVEELPEHFRYFMIIFVIAAVLIAVVVLLARI